MTAVDSEIIERSLVRLVDRLRSASLTRLTRPDDRLGGQSLTDAAYDLAAWCVERFQSITNQTTPDLPRLDPFAAGDQVWVTARELIMALDASDDGGDAVEDQRRELARRIDQLRAVS